VYVGAVHSHVPYGPYSVCVLGLWSGTHREWLGPLLDDEALYQVGEDVAPHEGLGCSALSFVSAAVAVSVSIPRGHDWSAASDL